MAAIEQLPASRRADIVRRVGDVNDALARAGLSAADFAAVGDDVDARRALAMRYFCLDQPCPLLFDGVCSVRDDRPLACREYLVASDPVHCGQPGDTMDQIVRIRSGSDVLRGFGEVSAAFGEERHRVLAYALADALRDGPPVAPPAEPRSGPRTAAALTPPAT